MRVDLNPNRRNPQPALSTADDDSRSGPTTPPAKTVAAPTATPVEALAPDQLNTTLLLKLLSLRGPALPALNRDMFTDLPATQQGQQVVGEPSADVAGAPAAHELPQQLAVNEPNSYDFQQGRLPSLTQLQERVQAQQADMGARLTADHLALLTTTVEPLLALVWTDMYNMQQDRLEHLVRSRINTDDGESPPADAEEGGMVQRRIASVRLPHPKGKSPHQRSIKSAVQEAAPHDEFFRAALIASALQQPSVVLKMFQTDASRTQVRFFRQDKAAHFLEQWHALAQAELPASLFAVKQRATSALTTPINGQMMSWVQAAEEVYMRLRQQGGPMDADPTAKTIAALKAIHGRAAFSRPVTRDPMDQPFLWRHLKRTDTPHCEAMVAITRDDCPNGLNPGHPYAVLGTIQRADGWFVALCGTVEGDSYSEPRKPFAVSFPLFMQNIKATASLLRRRG